MVFLSVPDQSNPTDESELKLLTYRLMCNPMQMLMRLAAIPEFFAEAAQLQLLHGHFFVALGIVAVFDELALGSISLEPFLIIF